MRTNLYSIYDTIAEVFNKPFTHHNDSAAIRAFTDSLKENQYNHKDDYALYAVGEWDDNKGVIHAYDVPKKIYTGLEIKLGQSISQDQQLEDLEVFKKQN